MSGPARPLLLLGVSGVGWDLLDAQIAAGRMPNLASLCERGVSLPLVSERVEGDEHFRPQVAWATLATGCSAARHGITRFFHEREDLREPTLWEHWQRAGRSVGVYGWPGTWPPPPTNGFLVPSHLARDDRTWPPELAELKAVERLHQDAERDPSPGATARAAIRLANVFRRGHVPSRTAVRLAYLGGRAACARGESRRLLLRRAKLELGVDAFLSLYRRFEPDCAAFVTFYLDLALHRFWRHWHPELFGGTERSGSAGTGDAIPRAFADVDRALGRLVAAAPPSSLVGFVSEHGMEPEPEPAELGDRYYAIRGRRVLDLIGLPEAARPCAVARWVAFRPIDQRPLPSDLSERMRAITITESGAPLFNVFEHGVDEVVVKLRLERTAAAAAGGPENLHVRFGERQVPFTSMTRALGETRSAMHGPGAALAVAGPGIRRGVRLGAGRLVDVLPTLAEACGVSLATSPEGTALDVFA